jgi:hypothetical protein
MLLLDHALIQLPEQRRRLAQCLAHRQLTLRPRPQRTAVVLGQGLVAARLFLVLDHLLSAEQLPLVAQVLMQLLCPVR